MGHWWISTRWAFSRSAPTAVFGRVAPFEAFDQTPGLGGGKGFVERSSGVSVEIVLDEDDRFGLREVDVGEVFQNVGIIDGGAEVGDLDKAPAFERCRHHEQVGHPVAGVFVIDAGRKPRPHRHRRARFGDELLGGLVQTNHRAVRIARPLV